MNETKPTFRRSISGRLWPVLTSAFVLTLLTSMLFLQGKAYREGWLNYFGLERSQFPISTTDAYWLTLYGWSHTATQWFSGAWSDYPKHLLKYGWLLFAMAFITVQIERYRIRRAAEDRTEDIEVINKDDAENRPKVPWLATVTGWKRWTTHVLLAIFITPISLAALPATLFFAGLVLALIIAIAIGPFQNIGRQAAIEFCSQPISRGAKIILSDAAKSPGWGYRVECNPDLCAIVRDGRVFVIPADQIQQIEMPPIEITKTSNAPTPLEEQLCPVPDAEN